MVFSEDKKVVLTRETAEETHYTLMMASATERLGKKGDRHGHQAGRPRRAQEGCAPLPAGAALEFPSIKKIPPFPCPPGTRRSHGCHTLKHPGNIKTRAHKDTRQSERKKSNTQNRDHQADPRPQTDSKGARMKHFYCFFLDELTVFQCTQMELGKSPFPSPNQVMRQR